MNDLKDVGICLDEIIYRLGENIEYNLVNVGFYGVKMDEKGIDFFQECKVVSKFYDMDINEV